MKKNKNTIKSGEIYQLIENPKYGYGYRIILGIDSQYVLERQRYFVYCLKEMKTISVDVDFLLSENVIFLEI